MNRQSKFFIAACSLTPLFLLASCAHNKGNITYTKAPTPQQATPTTRELIQHAGVHIIQQGERLQFIIPVDKFFETGSINIRESKIQTLLRIAKYLKHYTHTHRVSPVIMITGHTDKVFSVRQRKKLSKQYANVVASYLWREGFSQKQLHTAGAGATENIANPKTLKGAGYNRRVVIQVNVAK